MKLPARPHFVHEAVTVSRGTRVAEAAVLMRKHHIGAVVLADRQEGACKPVGILTDRDIVVEVVAAGLDARALTVDEIAQGPIYTASVDASSSELVHEMSKHGVRRLPVLNADGTLAGIVSLDDVLLELAGPLMAVGKLPGRERRLEARSRSS